MFLRLFFLSLEAFSVYYGAPRVFPWLLFLDAVFIPVLLFLIGSGPCYAMLQCMSEIPKSCCLVLYCTVTCPV